MFQWIFVIAEIHMPIIGADFLQKNGLLVDLKHGCLVDIKTNLQTQGTISHVVSLQPPLHLQQHSTEYDPLVAKFPSVTKPCIVCGAHSHTPHPHYWSSSSHQSLTCLHWLPIAKQEFEHKMEQEIIQPSKSQWSSLFYMVPKETLGD